MTQSGWNPELPIRYLPSEITLLFQKEADFLRKDLLDRRNIISYRRPCESQFDGEWQRVAESFNPEWYRSLFRSTPHLKRQRTLHSLERIASARDLRYRETYGCVHPFASYDTLYREEIRQRLTEGFLWESKFVPPNAMAEEYFSNISHL
ncbi:hypothetical protein HY496_03590 [Candidatus Woesearchaeota archaeon]|nr:hypothetical protein [Candidatus Woesearchaeota archaeon]